MFQIASATSNKQERRREEEGQQQEAETKTSRRKTLLTHSDVELCWNEGPRACFWDKIFILEIEVVSHHLD